MANTVESIQAQVGREIGVSGWMAITQAMVDRFADLTDDHQFIHVNPRAAARTQLGGTIAHGFLVLSMISPMLRATDIQLSDAEMMLNYGFEKIRFVSPVRSGSRIRGRFVLKGMMERGPGQWLSTLQIVIEIENAAKPAVIAEWLGLQSLKPHA
jgi:acyl dehydratase